MSKRPVVALLGRPNVGKSTLFNRFTGRRTAIVEDIPGTTRDRLYGNADWNGVDFMVVDTGGLEADPEISRRTRQPIERSLASNSIEFITEVRNQAQVAIEEADVLIFVVDGKDGMTAADEELAEMLRRTHKPVLVAANKTENTARQLGATEFWNLGLGEPFPISAYHGDGVGDLLDQIITLLPAYTEEEVEDDSIKIAIVGRPNVGKSSLLNLLIGQQRSIVSDVAGTTRDAIDTKLLFHGQPITLIDTAGIRRRGRVEPGIEKYSVLRSAQSIERAEVTLLLIDAIEGVTAQDTHIAGMILEKRKGIIVLINKWDAIEKNAYTIYEFTEQVRRDLKFMDYVPVLFISALHQQRTHKILPLALEVAEERTKRIRTSEFNQLLQDVYPLSQPPSKGGRRLRLYYGTQVGVSPPTFVIFVNDVEMVHFSYERFLENRIREVYQFTGTPIRLIFRPRKQTE